jgi:hypothetical protein
MRRSSVTTALGALLLIAAVAGFVIVPEHKPNITYADPGIPSAACGPPIPGIYQASGCTAIRSGVSHTLYDGLRIATWAVLIVGVLLVVVGLINYARRAPETQTPPRTLPKPAPSVSDTSPPGPRSG